MSFIKYVDRQSVRIAKRLGIGPPHLFNLNYAGAMRYIQATREPSESRNPDNLVGRLLSPYDRIRARLTNISEIRANKFYQYILPRTLHYDKIFGKFIGDGGLQIVIFGVGTDTRSMRFVEELDAAGASVIEADLDPWLSKRASRMQRFRRPAHLSQQALDLETANLPEWFRSAGIDPALPTLYLAEGVAPYLTPAAMVRLLDHIGAIISPDSLFAYDAKLQGFGENGKFRVPADLEGIRRLHKASNLIAEQIVFSAELVELYGAPAASGHQRFDEDVLLCLSGSSPDRQLGAVNDQ